jgi:hypothetical protein
MRLITDVLRDIRKGRVVDAASEELAELVRATSLEVGRRSFDPRCPAQSSRARPPGRLQADRP